jgi:hypothetical protein
MFWGLVCPDAFGQECLKCHRSTNFIAARRSIIQEWLSRPAMKNQTGHVFLAPIEFQRVLQSIPFKSQTTTPPGFFKRLAEIVVQYSEATVEKAAEAKQSLQQLMTEGLSEVSVFQVLFAEGLRIAGSNESEIQALINLQRALEKPFVHLHLQKNTEYCFQNDSRIRVSRIPLLFSGMKENTRQTFSFHNQFHPGLVENKNYSYRGIITMDDKKLGSSFSLSNSARYVMSSRGGIMALEALPGSILTANLRNMAGMLFRVSHNDFADLRDEKILWVDYEKVRDKQIIMQMKSSLQNIEVENGNVFLPVNFVLKQNGGFLSFSGSGRARISPDGIIHTLDLKVGFQARVLGLPLVRGRAENSFRRLYSE